MTIDPSYIDNLDPASRHSLLKQGGHPVSKRASPTLRRECRSRPWRCPNACGRKTAIAARCRTTWRCRRSSSGFKGRRIDFAGLSAYPLVAAGYADESIERSIVQLYGLRLPFADQFAINTSDLATVQALLTSSDAIAPSTDIAVASALRSGTVVPLDVVPPLELELTLGIVRRTGRTLVPAAEHAFVLVRRFFAEARSLVRRERRKTLAGRKRGQSRQPHSAGRDAGRSKAKDR